MRYSHALTLQPVGCPASVPACETADVTSPKFGKWSGMQRELNPIRSEAPPVT